jgi:hypothetical protein
MSSTVPGIPDVALPLFKKLRAEPLQSTEALKQAVIDYVRNFDPQKSRREVVNPIRALQISRACVRLLEFTEDAPEESRRLAHAACRYFIIEDDGTKDSSPGGLEDDAAVVNAVAAHLGLDVGTIRPPEPA